MYEIDQLEKTYNLGKTNAVCAINKVNLDIEEGEFISIVGESGSGKSTLLHILGGLDIPTSGTVLYKGKKINYKKPTVLSAYRNKQIGFVLQDFGLLNEDTVIQNVSIPLYFANHPFSKIKKTAEKALELVGIEDLKKRKVSELSGGQKQRVAIARALVNEPNVILADEPTGALDSKTSEEIMSVFIELNKQGKTIIMVTHNLRLASKTERAITISDGKLVI